MLRSPSLSRAEILICGANQVITQLCEGYE